jgi:hypothetical protein
MGTWKLLEDMMKKIEILVHVLSRIVCVCLTLDVPIRLTLAMLPGLNVLKPHIPMLCRNCQWEVAFCHHGYWEYNCQVYTIVSKLIYSNPPKTSKVTQQ